MKRQFPVRRCVITLCATAFLFASTAARAELVYDNSTGDLNTRFDPGLNEVGDEIVLGGTARSLTSFRFQYWGEDFTVGDDVQARIRFYANDGALSPAGAGIFEPSSVLFDSDWFHIDPTNRATLIFTDFITGAVVPLSSDVPDSFTWSIQFDNLPGGGTAGVDLYDPPTTGGNYNEYWDNTGVGGWEYRGTNGVTINFAAQANAVPEPAIIAFSLLGGLAALFIRLRFKQS